MELVRQPVFLLLMTCSAVFEIFLATPFYFAFGENDAYLILDVPDNLTAAAISLAVAGAGATRMKTVELLTPEEIDRAMLKHVDYTPPG